MAVILLIEACLIPIMSILAFIVGFNINAPKKIGIKKKEKKEKTEDEKMLERIENAHI